MGGDVVLDATKRLRYTVSIHAPVWGATCAVPKRDKLGTVSIHAPVWGATQFHRVGTATQMVSIHAPVWGATAVCLSCTYRLT